MPTVFTKIINKEIPALVYYEDHLCMAIKDINPVAPAHAILFPKKEIPNMDNATEEDRQLLGHCLLKAVDVANKLKLNHGYRLVINTKEDGGQTVPHIHIHILGGRALNWPPG